jgi:hypothetical protein
VVFPPGVKALTLGFVGGKTQPATVVSPFVYVAPPTPTLGYMGVTLASGVHLDCGAGAIGSVQDLTDDTLTARALNAPWACTAPQ